MAVNIRTITPKELLAKIKKAIDDGHVDTWEYDEKGSFTHSPDQWKDKAWLTPTIEQGALVFRINGPEESIPLSVWGVYHGRFIEMLLSHFHKSFANVWVAAAGT